MEFERLAQRLPSEAELAIAQKITNGCSVWAEGLRPEALALLSVALSAGEDKNILFVSPNGDLTMHRQLRLGTRGPCKTLESASRASLPQDSPSSSSALGQDATSSSGTKTVSEHKSARRPSQSQTVWATPDAVDIAHIGRTFGTKGPCAIVIEDAHATTSSSFSYRPSLEMLSEIIARFPRAAVVGSSAAYGHDTAKRVGKALGIRQFSSAKSYQSALVAEAATKKNLNLRVERDEEKVMAAITGPLPRPAVVLCGTPAQADEVYGRLQAEQVPVHRYHAGLSTSERARELVHFALPGRRAVLVAVSSFGPTSGFAGSTGTKTGSSSSSDSPAMADTFGHGYARRDLRSIVHLCAPCSLEQYSQELAMLAPEDGAPTGPPDPRESASEAVSPQDDRRSDEFSGREEGASEISAEDLDNPDNLDASDTSRDRRSRERSFRTENVGLMLYNPAHLALNAALLNRKRLAPEMIGAIVSVFLRQAKDSWITSAQFEEATGSPRNSRLALSFLEDAGIIESKVGSSRMIVDLRALKTGAKRLEKSLQELSDGDQERLQKVEDFALSEGCRVKAIARLLDQEIPHEECGRCDVCHPVSFMELQPSGGSTDVSIDVSCSPGATNHDEARPGRRRAPAQGERRRRRSSARTGDDFHDRKTGSSSRSR